MESSLLDLTSLKELLDRRTRDLEASEARLQSVIQYNADGIIIVDWMGQVKFANPAAQNLLGRASHELIGAPFGFPVVAGETAEIEIVPRESKPGSAIAEMRVVEMEWDGQAACLASLRDITKRRQRERELETIVMVTGALREASTRAEMIPLILDQSVTLLQAEGAAFALADTYNDQLVIEHASGKLKPWTNTRLPLREYPDKPNLVYWSAHWSDNPQHDPRYAAQGVPPNVRSLASVPFIANKQGLGILWIARHKPFEADEMQILAVIADIAANALQRIELQHQTEERLKYVQTLHAIDMSISASLDPRVTLDLLLGSLTSQLNVDAARVLLVNADAHTLQVATSRGMRVKTFPQTLNSRQNFPAERVIVERKPIYIRDLHQVNAEAYRALVTQDGLQAYYGVPLICKGQVRGVLETFYCVPCLPDQDWLEFLQAVAAQAALAVDNANAFTTLERTNLDLALAYDHTIEQISRAVELRDQSAAGHTRRIAERVVKLAQMLGIKESDLLNLRRGALLHDIGMLAVPEHILHKPDSLTADEYKILRRHPIHAQELLAPITLLRSALDIPVFHHERWDGQGYPHGLQGERIPFAARLFAVVETWVMLQTPRPWRTAWDRARTHEFLHAQSGVLFDPNIVEPFLRMD